MTSLSDGLEKLEQIVPGLSWSIESITGEPRALSIFGVHGIWQAPTGWYWQSPWHDMGYGPLASQLKAKAAAEADYRARIASALNLEPLLSEIKRMREALDKANRTATDRLYMMTAYRQMLGPTGEKVAAMWDERGVRRQHTDWGPMAHLLSGEERAQAHLDTEAAMKRAVPVGEIDGQPTQDPTNDRK